MDRLLQDYKLPAPNNSAILFFSSALKAECNLQISS